MARLLPQTMEELAAIEGIDERRAALYGEDFLLLIRVYRKAQEQTERGTRIS